MKTLVIYYEKEKYGKPLKYPEIITLSEKILSVEMEKWQHLADTSDNAIMFDSNEDAGVWRYALEFRRIHSKRVDKFAPSMKDIHNKAVDLYPDLFV